MPLPGKPYSLRERKQIVDYITEHRAFSEIKARKMWMDMANSRTIDRTWQSLKETFLKRILPDIHNPYYKLTLKQIASFRQGYDVESRNKNKLDIVTISGDSSSTDNCKSKEKTNRNEDETTGEDPCSKIHLDTPSRSSTDTLVLEKFYETAEDVQRALESPKSVEDPPPRTLRDCITYSEPLTPMLQEVIHDFDTDDDEPQMQIVEEVEVVPDTRVSNSPEPIRESQSFIKTTATSNDTKAEEKPSKIKSLKLKKTTKGTWENKECNGDVTSIVQEKKSNDNESHNVFTCESNLSTCNQENVEKDLTLTNDTPLPNNQEGLADKSTQKRTSNENTTSDFLDLHKKEKSGKRSRSQSSNDRKKKKSKKSRETSQTRDQEKDTETFDSHPLATIEVKDAKSADCSKNSDNHVTDNTETEKSIQDPSINKTNEEISHEAGPSGENNGLLDPTDVNPCLKSVNLFSEQFSRTEYSSDSEKDSKKRHSTDTKANEESKGNPNENTEGLKQSDTSSIQIAKSTEDNSADNSNKTNLNSLGAGEILLLKSHSESDSENACPKKRNSVSHINKTREKALANVFGFSSASHRRTMNHKSRLPHRKRIPSRTLSKHIVSGSSDEYTTASDSDEGSPRPRSSAFSRKYVKPTPYNILEHPDGGGMFVVGRNKIYPLLLKENGSLHYALAGENGDYDANDSYWKTKYMEEKNKLTEEKIRADELSKLLQKAKEALESQLAPKSPILQSNQSLSTTSLQNQQKQSKLKEEVAETSEKKENGTLKVNFKINNLGMELEGQWPHINPFLEKMMDIMKSNEGKESLRAAIEPAPQESNPKPLPIENNVKSESTSVKETVKARKSKKKVEVTGRNSEETVVLISSGKSTPMGTTPLDPEVHEKINKMEKEIFKKIEEIDKTDQSINDKTAETHKTDQSVDNKEKEVNKTDQSVVNKEEEVNKTDHSVNDKIQGNNTTEQNANDATNDVNVTKRRRGRPKKMSLSTSGTSLETVPKKVKETDTLQSKQSLTEAESDAGSTASKRPKRAPRRYESDSGFIIRPKRKKSLSKLSLNSEDRGSKEHDIPEDDPNIRYMFPRPSRARQPLVNADKSNNSYSDNEPRIFASPDNSSRHSESTQGYQDSDISPPNAIVKKKKRMSVATQQRKSKRKSSPYLADDDSCETIVLKHQSPASMSNASLNSEVYTSESYQILVPKQRNINQLDRIDESPVQNETTNPMTLANLTPLTIDVNNEYYIPPDLRNNLSKQRSSECNSSNISLPLSPELSVVESLSISREMIGDGHEAHPTINEIQLNDLKQGMANKYLISDVDVSFPLMEQNCELLNQQGPGNRLRPQGRRSSISEFIQTSIYSSNIQEQSSSESLDQRLRDLLLESAKKMAQVQTDNVEAKENMEIDATEASVKKIRAKKRCSTPRKKIKVPKMTTPVVEPVLEEHTETCSFGGRNSGPPAINVLACDVITADDNNNSDKETVATQTVPRKKSKDVIKVKILKPRKNRSGTRERAQSATRLSVCTDSGINDTGSGTSDQDCKCCVTTELIHNHSDTCLHADECIGDISHSVEILEYTQSIISLNSNSVASEVSQRVCLVDGSNTKLVTPELFCTDAQDATNFNEVPEPMLQRNDVDGTTVYHTPKSEGSFNSLLTEDLSDEAPTPQGRSSWFLLSEEDTYYADAQSQHSNAGSFGSNLKQIFPVTCAVPNLSTITESSKDNECAKSELKTEDKILEVQSQSKFDF